MARKDRARIIWTTEDSEQAVIEAAPLIWNCPEAGLSQYAGCCWQVATTPVER
jgi:hypothetical protein